jgi:Cytochrome c554 and c-prime
MAASGAIRRIFSIFALLLALIGLGLVCPPASASEKLPEPTVPVRVPPPASAYAGDAACASCHEKQAGTYFKTAHHLTSGRPDSDPIEGSFKPGSNVLYTANPGLAFVMNAVDGGYVQSAVNSGDPAHVRAFTEPFDIVVGAGRQGQAYLYWSLNDLFELPVSYWQETHSWTNTPGFPDGQARFDMPIVPRCLDCHASYFESMDPPLNRYNKSSLVLGITCEKCHGPGIEHVKLERSANPPAPGSANVAIINPAHLSRQQQLDSCSLCHAGAAVPSAPVGSFLPGDDINKFLKINNPGPDGPIDVHGSEVLLLRRSRCFQSSQMTCSTCHDAHEQQRDVAAISAHCITCHTVLALSKSHPTGESIGTKCVDCHMPFQRSALVISNTNGQRLTPLLRTHRIGIYPDVSALSVP